ncbi:hypothetical protein [Mesorhizobium sp. 128a]
MPETEDSNLPEGFEWAVVEIFGHRKHAGRACEVERFGAKMLRIDVPTIGVNQAEGQPPEIGGVETWTTHFYGGSSLFSYTLTDEASVMRANKPYLPPYRYLAPPDRSEDGESDDAPPSHDDDDFERPW